MIDGKKVVAFTPFGRERTVSILVEYLRRDHEQGIVDEYWLCMNTDPGQMQDAVYGYRLAKQNEWIKAVRRPAGVPRLTPKQRNTGYFYRYMTDPDTVYVRFDDDIVYVHPDAIERLVRKRLQLHSSTLTAFAHIWNNAICSYFAQKHGIIPLEFGEVKAPYCMDQVGWGNGAFAVSIHRQLLEALESGDPRAVERLYLYQDVPLAPLQQFSVSCFAVDGRDYATLEPPGHLDSPEEEHWHTVHRPVTVGKGNLIIGDALVSHLTFMNQQHAVFSTDILDRYRALAQQL